MPFDKLPGYNINVPVQQFDRIPARITPAKGPIIADAIQGITKLVGEHFSPAARNKKRLSDLQIKMAEKKYQDVLSGVGDPTQLNYQIKQQELQNKKALHQNINARTQKLQKGKEQKPNPQDIYMQGIMEFESQQSVEPPLPEPEPLAGVMLPELEGLV